MKLPSVPKTFHPILFCFTIGSWLGCQNLNHTPTSDSKPFTTIAYGAQPQLLQKVKTQRALLSGLGIPKLPIMAQKAVVARPKFYQVLAQQINAQPEHSPDFWEDSVAMTLTQIDLTGSPPAREVINDTINTASINPQALSTFKNKLKKVVDSDDVNIFGNSSEAVYVVANRILNEPRSIDVSQKRHSPFNGFSVELLPKDIVNSYLLKCDQELCQASLVKPVSLKRSIPLGLNANIDIVFSQTIDPATSLFTYEIAIDGQYKPIHIGKILAVSVSAGVDVTYVPKSGKFGIKNPRCSLEISCNTPLAAFTAQLSNTGIAFDASIPLTGIAEHLAKLTPNSGHVTKNLSYQELGENLRTSLTNLPTSTSPEDIVWNDLLSHSRSPTPQDEIY